MSCLPQTLLPYKGRVDLVVRNFPLSYHPYAYGAAVAAEATRPQGKFDAVHEALMATRDLSQTNIRKIVQQNGVDMRRFDADSKMLAVNRIKGDQAEFNALHLTGTPTFIVCTPKGDVLKLTRISQLQEVVK